MKSRSFRVSLFVCLSVLLFGSRAGSAQEVQPLEPEWLRQMYEKGWHKVQEGVLQRSGGEGQVETFSYGAEGLQWVIERSEGQLAGFEEKYREAPTEELAAAIEQLRGRIESLNQSLMAAGSAEAFNGEALQACPESSYAVEAWAGPQRSPRGVAGSAHSSGDSSSRDNDQRPDRGLHGQLRERNLDRQYNRRSFRLHL